MAIRRKTSEEAGMAAVREVRALFASFEDSSAAPAEPVPAEVSQAFAALPRSVPATFVRFTLEEPATLAPGKDRLEVVTQFGGTHDLKTPRKAVFDKELTVK